MGGYWNSTGRATEVMGRWGHAVGIIVADPHNAPVLFCCLVGATDFGRIVSSRTVVFAPFGPLARRARFVCFNCGKGHFSRKRPRRRCRKCGHLLRWWWPDAGRRLGFAPRTRAAHNTP